MAGNIETPLARATETTAWHRLVGHLGVELRRGEGTVAALLFVYFFLIVAFQYVAKSVRQSTFIDDLGADRLPLVYLVLAFCTVPVLLLYNRFVDRVPRHHLIAATSVVVALTMVGFWWLYKMQGAWIRVAFYVWVSIVFVLNVSQFWSYANHRLDTRQAKRLFGFVGCGGLLGGIAGGQIAGLATSLVDTRFALLVAAAILLGATVLIYVLQRGRPFDDEETTRGAAGLGKLQQARGGFAVIRGSRHLSLVAALMFLTIVVANVVDVQFNWAMEQATAGLSRSERLDALTGGYGNFYTIMGIAALAFQLLFTSRIHRRLGIGFAMRVLPVTMGLGTAGLFLAATMFPGAMLAVCRVLKVGENGLRYSLDQATRELLFLPVPSRERLKAKAYIDVFVQRAAKAGAGLLLLPVTLGLFTVIQAGWISLGLIVVWLAVTVAARGEYVRSFRTGLRQQTVDDALPINVSDGTTLEILVESLGSVDGRQVLHSLEILSANGRERLVPPLLLLHDDAEVRMKTLEVLRSAGRRDAVPLIERRIGDPDPRVRAGVINTLIELRGAAVDTMMLPRLHDPDPRVRAAAVAALAAQPAEQGGREALATLCEMVSDAEARVRAEAATTIGSVDPPRFQNELVRLLYDPDSEVARRAVASVRRRVERAGFDAIYAPIVVSLLGNRRLKHVAREALVAFGEDVIPALVHFLVDPRESIWVRRALPKTLARVGVPEAIEALLELLSRPCDGFLRRKVIEALVASGRAVSSRQLEQVRLAIRYEVERSLRALLQLEGLGALSRARWVGPCMIWDDDDGHPALVEQLLAERMHDGLRNAFLLLSLLHKADSVQAAYASLLGGRPIERNNALEYLENSLRGETKRLIFALVGDETLDQRLRNAGRVLASEPADMPATLRAILVEPDGGIEDRAALRAAALYAVYTEQVGELYGQVASVGEQSDSVFVRETARWVAARLRPAAAP